MEPRGGEVRRGRTGLLDPVMLAGRTAPSRVIFGPHETNLGSGRALYARHVAYYQRRAAGGAGVIVTEVASVHESDWPYERAPLAADCRDGWRQIADACHTRGALVLAGLGHTGLQGSSAFSQRELWGPSGFTDVVSRETPMVMEQPQIDAVITGFAAAAATAAESGADGVEIDAGPGALLRQFHNGRMAAGINFMLASGYTGQTTEVLALPGESAPFERVTGVYLPSYVTASYTYRFR